jgi:Mrp family chromosome partitioning ATPase
MNAEDQIASLLPRPPALAPRFFGLEDAKRLVFSLRYGADAGVVIQLVAAGPGEGTSSLSRDLAVVAASMGARVLLLDLGGRPYTQQRELKSGFNLALLPVPAIPLGQSALPVYRAESHNLTVAEPDWTAEMMSATAGADLFKALRDKFDLVVIDSAPISVAYDSVARAHFVDTTLLVVRAEKTRVAAALTLRNRIFEAGGPIGGVLFNCRRFYIPAFLYRRI